jgi:aspartyl-tRNA(Asn)/glutamyl-tRNA(Gln) amidotransferase subunit A
MSLTDLTLHAMQQRLRNKEVTSVELTRAFLERIGSVDQRINAYLTVTADQALEAAARADRRLAEGQGAELTGIPLALKDIFVTEGVRTTCASQILANFVPPYDGTAVPNSRNRMR